MPDRLFYPLAILAVVAMIVLASVWPQGLGARSPGPFGHPEAPKLRNPLKEPKIKPPELL